MFKWGKKKLGAKDQQINELIKELSDRDTVLQYLFHEIAIPLSSLFKSIEKMENLTSQSNFTYLDEIRSNAERVNAIIGASKILFQKEYGGEQVLDNEDTGLSWTNINQVIESAVRSLRSVFPDLKFATSYGAKCFIVCSKNELMQCFVNLFVNSYEAYHDCQETQKLIYIRSCREKSVSESIWNVLVEVEDHATGIPPEMLTESWRAGFSTKSDMPGQRGQGLAIVKNLVSKYGDIKVMSPITTKDGKEISGTRFTLLFKGT